MFDNGNLQDNNISYGCVSPNVGVMRDFYNRGLFVPSDTVYVGNQNPENKFVEQNGHVVEQVNNKVDNPKKFGHTSTRK